MSGSSVSICAKQNVDRRQGPFGTQRDFGTMRGQQVAHFIAAPPNSGLVWVRVVDEVSGAVFKQEFTADPPADTRFLSPRLFLKNGATAAAVSCDCSGVYRETDY